MSTKPDPKPETAKPQKPAPSAGHPPELDEAELDKVSGGVSRPRPPKLVRNPFGPKPS